MSILTQNERRALAAHLAELLQQNQRILQRATGPRRCKHVAIRRSLMAALEAGCGDIV